MCLFSISHFSSTVCSEAMAKRSQQDSGEERVTAKSRPMMSLIARAPSNIYHPRRQKARWREAMEIKSLECESWERGSNGATRCGQRPEKPRRTIVMNNLLKALSQHAFQSGMITKLGLLKSGKLTHRCLIDRGNPMWPLGKKTRESPNKFLSWEDPAWWNRAIRCERGNTSWKIGCDPMLILKEKQCHNNLSLETMKQNKNCQWNPDHS